ncbi:MAG: hypothetical protein JWP57_3434 [Spirosoma sp.]|nr:hypothetical protein [Spirosoma sp.]
MKTKLSLFAIMALFLSVGAYAQSQPHVHKAKIPLTPEDQTDHKVDHKAKLAGMTPTERKAFKQTHQAQRQARLNTMTPEQRARKEERRRLHKETKGAGK